VLSTTPLGCTGELEVQFWALAALTPPVPFEKRMGGPYNQSGHSGEKEKAYKLPKITYTGHQKIAN